LASGRDLTADTLASMCLLVVVSRLDPGAPLVVGANRDERLDRPALAMTVLRAVGPRVLGGRDEEAGGTWLAVNEHGVVAGLTNRPSPDGADPSKRTRGELPLTLAGYRDAAEAVRAFVEEVRPSQYNPAWLLVGDRESLYALDVTGDARPHVEELGPGVHVLENNPLGSPSVKVDRVLAQLGDIGTEGAAGDGPLGDALLDRLRAVLVDHTIPGRDEKVTGASSDAAEAASGPASRAASATVVERPPASLAACVHTESYGTRSSSVVRVPGDPESRPTVLVADGHPCSASFVDVTGLWDPGTSN
jgi:uncharacterized protein with NRDE domain